MRNKNRSVSCVAHKHTRNKWAILFQLLTKNKNRCSSLCEYVNLSFARIRASTHTQYGQQGGSRKKKTLRCVLEEVKRINSQAYLLRECSSSPVWRVPEKTLPVMTGLTVCPNLSNFVSELNSALQYVCNDPFFSKIGPKLTKQPPLKTFS